MPFKVFSRKKKAALALICLLSAEEEDVEKKRRMWCKDCLLDRDTISHENLLRELRHSFPHFYAESIPGSPDQAGHPEEQQEVEVSEGERESPEPDTSGQMARSVGVVSQKKEIMAKLEAMDQKWKEVAKTVRKARRDLRALKKIIKKNF
uniref:Uncharacterized protein n=1 Tax=Pyxicephalus adspersus TaxID=30357 RepID=A0AAV3AV51_PYXAD|nr:TPA: hypothetical protein GDO54_010240 [Pyxicephalus adspersus]